MKILMVSMPSLHFFRWTEQLKDAGHDIYWFDVTDGGAKVERISWVHQIVGWKLKWKYPGRYFIKNKLPKVYDFFQHFNENNTAKIFEQKLLEIQPDIVHSFALYVSCSPILSVMQKYPTIKWCYSSWGSDLFYFQNQSIYLKDIKAVLPRINYLFSDCYRDFEIAKKYGFDGKFLGVFPGGGGFSLDEMENYSMPFEDRNTILIKGFQGRSGKALVVLNAISQLEKELEKYKIVIFGADKEVLQYFHKSKLASWSTTSIFGKMKHLEVLKLMGSSLIYIGNSNSDGIPNTMLEAICMNVFPIQSNPGGVTQEIITHKKNGLLIEDCENVDEIIANLKWAISFDNLGILISKNNDLKQSLDINLIRNKVKNIYEEFGN